MNEKWKTAWRYGWPWSLLMFLILVVWPMVRDRQFDPRLFLVQLLFWVAAAFLLGWWIGFVLHRQSRR